MQKTGKRWASLFWLIATLPQEQYQRIADLQVQSVFVVLCAVALWPWHKATKRRIASKQLYYTSTGQQISLFEGKQILRTVSTKWRILARATWVRFYLFDHSLAPKFTNTVGFISSHKNHFPICLRRRTSRCKTYPIVQSHTLSMKFLVSLSKV